MKNLPIQLVEFRGQQDEFIHEPGGNDELPQWISKNKDICYANSARVHEQMNMWDSLFDEREEQHNNMPLLFEIELHEKAESKSYRKSVKKIFNTATDKNILGLTDRRKLLVKANNRSELRRMSGNFALQRGVDINNQKMLAYAAVSNTNLFSPQVDEYTEGENLKIRLVNFQDANYNKTCVSNLRQLCEAYGQPCEKLDYVDELLLYKTKAASPEFVNHLASIDGILSIEGMPTYGLDFDEIESNEGIVYDYPEEGQTYPLVGLMDTGVIDAIPFQPWKDGLTQVPDEWVDVYVKRHGSSVASILLYGDKLCGENRTGAGPCTIRDCVVNVVDAGAKIDEDKLIGYIKKAIADNPDVKIWNCSMGSLSEAPLNKISDFAKTLDKLQQDYDILICKSAGNKHYEYNRITNGADSLLSLVVGSTSIVETQEGNLTEDWSPDSCIGLAAGAVIKPDLASLGGDREHMIRVINECGAVIQNAGTSFSTPRVTAMAANLAYQLGEQYNPLLIKALLVHNAAFPAGMDGVALEDKVCRVGYGIPAPVNEIIHNDENEITMVFPCQFRKGCDYRVIQFVYPEGLVENGYFYGDITLTLVINPILNVSQGGEYCQTNVDVSLHTYEDERRIDMLAADTPRTIRNPIRLDDNQNVLKEDNYSHRRNRNGLSNLFECNRIEKNHKYSPIKKIHVDLEQMTNQNKINLLASHRQWALKLRPLFREEAEGSMAADKLKIDAYLVMTIRDPKHKGVVYNQAIAQLDAKNFVHHNIVIHQDIGVDSVE